MLSFLVFEGDRPQAERVLRHAFLIGPESVPIAGEIRFERGVISCTKPTGETSGFALQVGLDRKTFEELGFSHDLDAGGVPTLLGQLTLQTCLLPERDRPYLLSLELARHRLMLFLNKLEDWSLFDLGPDHPIMRLFEDARHAFTEAVVAQGRADVGDTHGFSAEAHKQAVRSLWLAVEAGERLALEAARRDFGPRVSGEIYERTLERSPHAPASRQRASQPVLSIDRVGVAVPTRPAIGCAVSPASFTEAAQNAAAECLDFLQVPMRWIEMEPEEGKYFWRNTDQWIEWAVRKAKIPVVAGPVIDFRQRCVPRWLYVWENDYDTLREFVYEHMKNLVTRYRRTIGRWTVLGGLHVNDNFHFSFDQMMDLTRICVLVVRKLHPTAQVILEITHPWGEYHTANRRSLPPMLYAEMVTQAGIMVDGFSLRVQMGQPMPGQSARDLMAFSAMLDRYAALDKPLSITAIGAPSGVPEAVGDPNLAEFHPGSWRAPWTEDLQADWASAVLAIALAKPSVQSVTWQELYDMPEPSEMPRGGIIAVDGTRKPIADRIVEMRRAVRDARLPERLLDPAWGPGAQTT